MRPRSSLRVSSQTRRVPRPGRSPSLVMLGRSPFALAVSDHFTTVWRTTLPGQRAFWFSGTFFAVKRTTLAPVWDALAEMTGEPLGAYGGASLYGEPLALNDADLEAWTGASVVVYDADGGVHPAITLSTTEDGLLTLSG